MKWYIAVFLIVLIAGGLYFFLNMKEQTLETIQVDKAKSIERKSEYVKLSTSIHIPDVKKSIYLIKVSGLEKELFYNISYYYSDEDIMLEAYVNVTVFNFLKDAYQNPTIAKCNRIKLYLNNTEYENITCTQLYNYLSDRIEKGWRYYKKGIELDKISVTGNKVTINFGKSEDDEELRLGDNSITLVQTSTNFYNSLRENITTEENNHSHLTINPAHPYDKLVLYYSFDGDQTNKTAYDWSKNNIDGSYFGYDMLNSSGWLNYGIYNPTGDRIMRINLPSNALLNLSVKTITLWHKTNTSGATDAFVGMGNAGNTYFYYTPNTRAITYRYLNGSLTSKDATCTYYIGDNQWHHIAVTHNKTGSTVNITTYVDGVFRCTTSLAQGDTSAMIEHIGARNTFNTGLNGSLDELMIFNESLGKQEIIDIYNNQSSRFSVIGYENTNGTISMDSGDNRLNISLNDFYLPTDSKLNISIGYYDTSWHTTQSQEIDTMNKNYTFNISTTTTNLTINYTLTPSAYNFFSGLYEGNVYLQSYLESAGATDDEYPQFSSYWDTNGTLAGSGKGLFNVTLTSTNGTVILNINGQTVKATNLTANVYNASYTFSSSGSYVYNWTAYGNGTSHNLNISNNRYYTVNTTPVTDNEYPQFSNYIENPTDPSTYYPSQTYRFNVTITSTNGTGGIEFNGVNYTLTNSSNNFTRLLSDFSAGTYNYYYWSYGNGTSKRYNSTAILTYTINKNSTNTLSLTATTPIEYRQATDFSGSGCPSQLTCSLNLTNGIFGVGVITGNYSTTGNTNYSAMSTNFSVTINKNSSLVLSISGTTPLEYPRITDVSGSGCPSELTCALNQSNAIYGASSMIFNYSTNGNLNYTSSSITKNIVINKNSSLVLSISRTSPITYGTSTDFSGSGCPSELTCALNLTNQVFGAGTINANYSTAGNANYTAKSNISNIIINKATSSIFTYINHTRSNKNYYNGTQVWLNVSLQTGGSGGVNLSINGTVVNTSTITYVKNLYLFNYTGTFTINGSYWGNENYTPSSETYTVTVTSPSAPAPSSNVTTVTSINNCRYKKFGYYNPNLVWYKEVNCI